MEWLSGSCRSGPEDRSGPRVVVLADHALVAEAVRTALATLGYHALSLDGAALLEVVRADVGVLLSDLDRPDRISGALEVVAGEGPSWLVLTGAPEGPTWGALYEGGACLVAPTGIGLKDTAALVDDLYAGLRAPARGHDVAELIGQWHRDVRRRRDLCGRIETLTRREDAVLRELYAGLPVRDIAERSEVSVTTVRSQVKAILRKLGVNSQIAAVAVYEEIASHAEDMTSHAGAAEGDDAGDLRTAGSLTG